MPTRRPAFPVFFLRGLFASAPACKKKEAAPAPPETNLTSATSGVASSGSTAPSIVEPAKAFVPSHPVPPFKGAFPHRSEPMANPRGRVVSIKFLRNGGDADVAPVFALTNLTNEPVRVGQTWIYYYDAQRKKIDRYPSSFSGSLELAPGETKEERIGQHIGKNRSRTTRESASSSTCTRSTRSACASRT